MLPRYPIAEAEGAEGRVILRRYLLDGRGREDATRFGAFRRGARLLFSAVLPRVLGASAVLLRIARDGEAETDLPFAYAGSDDRCLYDRYELTLDTASLCGEAPSGLFFYRLLLARAPDALLLGARRNADAAPGGPPFRLLVYEEGFHVPAWFGRGVLYHIFVDRFRRGAGEVCYRAGDRGALLDPDWDTGVPPYPREKGGALSNRTHFGGNLWGVAEELDYLASLGVTVLYLSPVFEASSNHKYDTGDYGRTEGGFGGERALARLLGAAHRRGMRVILDGVFNHTGDDSVFFNRYGTYGPGGAYRDERSRYRGWYRFRDWPEDYESWWNIPILPRLDHRNPECRRFFTGPDGVGARRVREGADGWRLDVADELPDEFLDEFRASVKEASGGEAVLVGEVWENAADKTAYGRRRRYLQGRQLDSVMNYPLREGILAFVRDGNAEALYGVLTELYASYPREVSDSLMNLVGTHDTARILTALGADPADGDRPNDELARACLSPARRAAALGRLRMATALQFTVYGIPSVYYGDEAAMEGFGDPFCRRPFPWRETDPASPDAKPYRLETIDWFRRLGQLRRAPALCGGDFRILDHGARYLSYERVAVRSQAPAGDGPFASVTRLVTAANRGDEPVSLPVGGLRGETAILSGQVSVAGGRLTLGPDSVCIVI